MRAGRTGFTLIEIIMTIVLVAIAAVPLSLLMSGHFSAAAESSERTMANHLARFEMEKVRKMPYANIVSAVSPGYLGYGYDVTRTVTFVQGGDFAAESLKKISVEVRKPGSAEVLASVSTYMARNVVYGL